MRHLWLLGVLGLAAALTILVDLASAQDKDDAWEPDTELVAPEKHGKVTLTVDAGGHFSGVGKILFMPDGTLVTVGLDHSIRLWDPRTGDMRKVLYPPGILATRKILTPHGFAATAAIARDGRQLALSSYYWDRDKALPVVYVLTLPEGHVKHALQGHTDTILALAFTADGKRLVSGGHDKTYRLWDLETGKTLQTVTHPTHSFRGLAISPDGKRLAHIADSRSLISEIVDLETGKPLAKPKKLLGRFVSWSPDGKTIAVGSRVEGLRLYEPNGKVRAHLLPKSPIHGLSFSADSRTLLVTWATPKKEQGATILDVATGQERLLFKNKGKVGSGVLSPDGQVAVTLGATAKEQPHELFVWKTADGKLLRNLAVSPWLARGQPAGWSANSQAVTWDRQHWFHLDKLQLGVRRPNEGVRGPIHQQPPLSLQMKGYFEVNVLKDKNPLAKITKTADQASESRPGVEMKMTFVGKDRVALSGWELRLYDAFSGKELRRFQQRGNVHAIASSPDGRYLLSTGEDQLLRVWNVEQERPLLTLYVRGKDWIAWTEAGYYAATPGGERLIGWKVDNGIDKTPSFYPAERFRKQMYRPDVLKLVLEKGSVQEALQTADAVLGRTTRHVELEQLLPPRAVLEVLDQSAAPQVKLRATATASAKGQPVTALRLLVDGRPLPEGAAHTEFKGVPNAQAVWAVTLPPGKHSLTVLARSPDASSVSETVEVASPLPARQAALQVLAVGIDAYPPPIPALQFAAADAQAIANAFQNNCKGPLFPQVASKPLLNAKATRAAVLQELDELRKKVGANDLVVVFFAGHGVKDKDKFYLLTVNARLQGLAGTALSGEDLRKALGEFPCQVLLMLDACHSAAGLKNFRPAVDDVTRTLTDDECGVAVLSAAMAHEKALEQKGNGLFTRAVVEALSRPKGVPYNYRDQRQYLHHLHAFVFDEVKYASEDRQHPFLSLPWVVESFALRQLP